MESPRLIQTYLSYRPKKSSALVALGFVLWIGVFSQMYWSGLLNDWPAQRASTWQNFTATLIHADWGHYLSNSYMLLILGYFVYGYFGFYIYPFFLFLLAAVTNFLTTIEYADNVRLLGASGLVYVLAGFWLAMFWLLQRQHRWHRRFLRVLGVALVVLFPTTFEPTTSYRAHAIGFFIGVAYAIFHFYLNKPYYRGFEIWKEPTPEVDPELSELNS